MDTIFSYYAGQGSNQEEKMSSAVASETKIGYFFVNQGNARCGPRADLPSFGEPGPVMTARLLHSAWYPLVVGTIS